MGFPHNSVGKESLCNAGGLGSIAGSGRCPEEGNGNPLQYSCMGNPMGRVAMGATVYGVSKESDLAQQLNKNNNNHTTYMIDCDKLKVNTITIKKLTHQNEWLCLKRLQKDFKGDKIEF